jgi:hypothetical protein
MVQRPPDVAEGGGRIIKEHRAEPADGQVEAPLRGAVDLRVGALEGDVVRSPRPGELASTIDRGRRDINPKRAACPGHGRDVTRSSGPAF